MKRVNYHLPEDQLARVQDLASRLCITAAELIRRALDRELAAHSPPAPETPRMATAKTARKSTMSPAQLYLFEAAKTPGKVSVVKRPGLNEITADHKYQSRTEISTNYIHSELRPILEQYGDLEPIVLFKEYGSERLFIGNGFHRYELYKMARRPDIPAIIIDAGEEWERELRLYSASANLKFSKPPTREDKIKALHMLFADEKLWFRADSELARRSGLTNDSVMIHRVNYSKEFNKPIPTMVEMLHADGKYRTFPYRINLRESTGSRRPNVYQRQTKPGRYAFSVGGKMREVKASSLEEAQEVANQKAVSYQASKIVERINRAPLSSASLRVWLTRRDIPSEQSEYIGNHVLVSDRAIIVSCTTWSSRDIAYASMTLMYAWKLSGFPNKDLVIACYKKDCTSPGIEKVITTLAAPGLIQIHFLTPEEIVQRYAPQEGQADQGGNGFH